MPTALQRSRDILAAGVARARAGFASTERQQGEPGPEIKVEPFDAGNVSTPAALIKLGTSIAAARRKRANFEMARTQLAAERVAKQESAALEADKTRAEIAKLRAETNKPPTGLLGADVGPYLKGTSQEDARIGISYSNLTKKPAPGKADDAFVPMDDVTLRMAALNYAKGGGLPPLGMSKASAKARMDIMNYAAHNFPALDLAANKADLQKNTRALTDLQKLYDSSTAFEATANANADVMIETIAGIPETGTRFGNKIGRFLASQMGSPQVSQFNTALETVKPEFARLLSSPGAGGMLTDTARREMQAVLGGDFTKEQLVHSLAVLKRDAANRRTAYSGQIDQIRARLAWNQTGANPNLNVSGQHSPEQDATGDVEWIMDADGNMVVKP